MDMDSPRSIEFVALEDWLNDGVPLVRDVARQCLQEWYRDNRPFNGAWAIGGEVVRPENVTIPSMIAVPKSDKIVPDGSALGLAAQLPDVSIVRPPSGHIGMMVGRQAEDGLWADVIRWINR
jgi:polyhydroxyalkanoate synthase